MLLKKSIFYFLLLSSVVSSCTLDDMDPPDSPEKNYWEEDNLNPSNPNNPNNPNMPSNYYFDLNNSRFKNEFIGEYEAEGCMLSVMEYSSGGVEINALNCGSNIADLNINVVEIKSLPNDGYYRVGLSYGNQSWPNYNVGYYGSIMLHNGSGFIRLEFGEDGYVTFIDDNREENIQLPWGSGNTITAMHLDYISNQLILWSGNEDVYTTSFALDNISNVSIGTGDPAEWYLEEFTIEKVE